MINNYYIVGFFDGEGSFTVNYHRPFATIAQKDVKVLHMIRDYFNCGYIRHNGFVYVLEFRSKRDLKTFSDFVRKNLQYFITKRKEAVIWLRMVDEYLSGGSVEHLSRLKTLLLQIRNEKYK